jgi:hypothetical protein
MSVGPLRAMPVALSDRKAADIRARVRARPPRGAGDLSDPACQANKGLSAIIDRSQARSSSELGRGRGASRAQSRHQPPAPPARPWTTALDMTS